MNLTSHRSARGGFAPAHRETNAVREAECRPRGGPSPTGGPSPIGRPLPPRRQSATRAADGAAHVVVLAHLPTGHRPCRSLRRWCGGVCR